jgi:hypothetical protein
VELYIYSTYTPSWRGGWNIIGDDEEDKYTKFVFDEETDKIRQRYFAMTLY